MDDKIESTGTNTEMNHMLICSDKNFKAAIMKTFQQRITRSLDKNKKMKISAKKKL